MQIYFSDNCHWFYKNSKQNHQNLHPNRNRSLFERNVNTKYIDEQRLSSLRILSYYGSCNFKWAQNFRHLQYLIVAFFLLPGEKCVQVCPEYGKNVCGSNGQTYSSFCELKRQNCVYNRDVHVQHDGACGKFIIFLWLTQ